VPAEAEFVRLKPPCITPAQLRHGVSAGLSPHFSREAGALGPESAKVLLPKRIFLTQEDTPMQTERSQDSFEFASPGSRKVTAAFDGGAITSNAGALLLRDRAIGLPRQVAACFKDGRRQDKIEHALEVGWMPVFANMTKSDSVFVETA
jgi:Transposase DDE domain group 1